MSTQRDERYFLDELVRLFDPARIHGLDDDALIKEIRQYYQGLSLEEQQVFEQATLCWLRSEDGLRQSQAISLCWILRLKSCVDDLLRLGSLHRELPSHGDLNWIVEALGEVGDAKAIGFLTEIAIEGSYRNSALVSISQIDLAQALQLIPQILEGYYQSDQSPVLAESLFWCLLHGHPKKEQGKVAWRLGDTLSCFPNKEYLLEQSGKALHRLDYDVNGKRLGKRDRQRLMQAFRDGLEKKPKQLTLAETRSSPSSSTNRRRTDCVG